ncbi:MAG: IPT/TIG domain-containing protein [Acidobacteriota bacterium]
MKTLRLTSACILFVLALTFAPAWAERWASRSNHVAAQGQPATIIRTIVYRQISSLTSSSVQFIGRLKVSADGQKIIFSGDDKKKVYTINADGTGFREIFDYSTFRNGRKITPFIDISVDGSRIIWTDGSDEIFVANFDGSNRQRIATAIPDGFNGTLGLNTENYAPRLTADGSRVYFYHRSNTLETEGVFVIDANGANLRRLFSYKQIATMFGLSDNTVYNICGASRFGGNLDISDNGARLLVGVGCTRGGGDALTFDGTTLRSLVSATGRVPGDSASHLALSGDGSRVMSLRYPPISAEPTVYALNFDGTDEKKLLAPTSVNGASFGGMTTNGAQALASTGSHKLPLLNTNGSGRVDLIIPTGCDVDPLFGGDDNGASSLAASGRRFAFRTRVPGEPQQLWVADINPASTGDAPRINEVAFNPNYVVANGGTASTFTARATDAQGGQGGLRRRTCGNALKNGAYEFRYLSGGAAFGIALFDNGSSGGDQTAGDGLFTQNQVRSDQAPPDPNTALQIRTHAIATSLRQITAVDATPFFVLAQAPGGVGPMITSINPSSGAAGIQVKITGSNFDPVAANNIVLFGNRQASVISATSDGTMLEVIVPPDLPAGTVAVTVTVRAQTSNAVNFNVTGTTATPTPTPTPCTSTTELTVDDGTDEFSVGYRDGATNAVFVNRLTPASYPATLQSISIFFTNSMDALPIGSAITILAAANPSGNSTLTTFTYQTTAATINTANAFNQYNVAPLTITSGDFIVGFRVDVPPGIYPAMLDTSSPSQMRSYYATGSFNLRLLDSISGLAGNYLIRAQLQGSGTTCPTPTPTPTPQSCPTVSGINPSSGLIGSMVTISGANFTGVTSVRFTNNVAAPFTINSDAQITVTVPTGAVNGPIDVLKPGCPDHFTPTFTVTRLCPTITNLNPSSGQVGSTVLISGTNFTGVNGVRFTNNVVAAFTVLSDTQISATVPNGATTGPLTVFKAFCPDTHSGTPFTVTQPGPCITVSIPTNLTGGPNSTLTVPVNVSDTTSRNVLSYDAVLTFDPAVLRLQNPAFDRAGTLSANLTVTTNSPVAGRVNISGFSSTPLAGAGLLLNLKFDVIGSLNACSDLAWTSFRFNEGTPCSTTTNGRACATGGGSIAGTINYCAASPPKPVPGVTITAAGTPAASATTDAAGNYQLPNLGGGPYTLTPAKTGDANGITSFDAAQIAQHVVGIITLSPCQQGAADTSGNGEITSFDAAFIAQYVVGITNPDNKTGTWKFLPPTRTYSTLNGPQTAQNFDAVLLGELTGNWVAGGGNGLLASVRSDALSARQSTLSPTQVAVSLPQTTGTQGSIITVPITVGDLTGRGFISYDFDLIYDAAVLQAASAPTDAAGTLSSALTITANATPGRLRVSAFGTTPLSGAGTLLNLKFNVAGAGGTALTWQRFIFNETPVINPVNGRVNVGRPVASVSAASFTGQQLAPDSIVAAFGENLATSVVIANEVPLPTTLAGTTVRVRDSAGSERPAPLFFVAPAQFNYLIPPGTAPGAATATVTSGGGQISIGTMMIAAVAPGIFTANASGQGLPAAVLIRVAGNGAQTFEAISRFDAATQRIVAVPIEFTPDTAVIVLSLYGTGWRFRSSMTTTTVTIGGTNAPVLYVGAQPNLTGLDQINMELPRSLIGRGEVDVVVTVDGKAANTVRVDIK